MHTNTIVSWKIPLRSCLTFMLAILSIDTAQAEDISSLKMSFSEPISSALPDTSAPKSDRQKLITRNASDRNEKVSWYFGTMRGANFPSLTATTDDGKSKGNWNGINSLVGLLELNNINGFVGYKSSNFRLEGEVMVANNPMSVNRGNTIAVLFDL